MSELGKRFLSSVVLAAALIGVLWVGGWVYAALLALGGVLVLREYVALAKAGWVAAVPRAIWLGIGIVYIALALNGLWDVRQQGFGAALLLFLAVWATDVGAFAFGKIIGGPRIAPSVSPSKTWAGYLGAILTVAATLMVALVWWPLPGMTQAPTVLISLIAAALIATVAQAGDFFESWLKRRAGVKDSGNLIPGHGGLFDRVDGLLALAALQAVVSLTAGAQ